MSPLTTVGLRVARELKERVGARAALGLLSTLIESSSPGGARAEAVLDGMACAVELGDRAALQQLAAHWTAERAGPRRRLAQLCERTGREAGAELASILAEAEFRRHADARARWLSAVCADRAGAHQRADRSFLECIEAAEAEGAVRVAQRARIAWAESLLAREQHSHAARLVAGVEPKDARDRWICARAKLGDAGRYARVEGLEALRELAQQGGWQRLASRAVLEHVDRLGDALTTVERERVEQIVAELPSNALRAEIRLRWAESSATSLGDSAASSLEQELAREPAGTLRAQALLAIAARGDPQELAVRLEALPTSFGCRTDASLWTALRVGIEHTVSRPAALSRLAALLEAAGTPAPPRGYLELASRLEALRVPELARRALILAVEHHERGARPRLVLALTRSAWCAFAEGERSRAHSILVEARALASA